MRHVMCHVTYHLTLFTILYNGLHDRIRVNVRQENREIDVMGTEKVDVQNDVQTLIK